MEVQRFFNPPLVRLRLNNLSFKSITRSFNSEIDSSVFRRISSFIDHVYNGFDVCGIFLYLHFSSTMCILEGRNLWILDLEVTVSSVASTMNSGKTSLDRTYRLEISPFNT